MVHVTTLLWLWNWLWHKSRMSHHQNGLTHDAKKHSSLFSSFLACSFSISIFCFSNSGNSFLAFSSEATNKSTIFCMTFSAFSLFSFLILLRGCSSSVVTLADSPSRSTQWSWLYSIQWFRLSWEVLRRLPCNCRCWLLWLIRQHNLISCFHSFRVIRWSFSQYRPYVMWTHWFALQIP